VAVGRDLQVARSRSCARRSSRKAAVGRDLQGLAKSNRTDADLLSRLGFEPPRLWEVWLPPPAVRQQREWRRYRMALVRTQTGLKNRAHAILHRYGLFPEVVKLFSATGRRWLRQPPCAPRRTPKSPRSDCPVRT
jgi:transposase